MTVDGKQMRELDVFVKKVCDSLNRFLRLMINLQHSNLRLKGVIYKKGNR